MRERLNLSFHPSLYQSLKLSKNVLMTFLHFSSYSLASKVSSLSFCAIKTASDIAVPVPIEKIGSVKL
jgi:hypothetical protein